MEPQYVDAVTEDYATQIWMSWPRTGRSYIWRCGRSGSVEAMPVTIAPSIFDFFEWCRRSDVSD